MRVRFTEEARAEALDARKAFAHRDPRTVEGFRVRLQQAVQHIGQFPESGTPDVFNTRRFPLTPFPYALIYRIDKSGVVVVAVPHAAQRPGYWAERA